jgi:hypothetical protein
MSATARDGAAAPTGIDLEAQPFGMPPALMEGNEEAARTILRNYFFGNDGSDGRKKEPANEGARFNTLGHAWDDKAKQNLLTPCDLLSLSTLSVPIGAKAALELVENRQLLNKIEALLKKIPVETQIVDDDAVALLGKGGDAWHLWNTLDAVHGFGEARASKLLARKRPLLVPIFDSNVATELGIADSRDFWAPMRAALLQGDNPLWSRARVLRDDLELGESITPLRIVDVVLWKLGADKAALQRQEAKARKSTAPRAIR